MCASSLELETTGRWAPQSSLLVCVTLRSLLVSFPLFLISCVSSTRCLLAESRSATSFLPTSITANDPSVRVVVTGTNLDTSFRVKMEAGTLCTPTGSGIDVTSEAVNAGDTELTLLVGGAGLPAGSYSMCIQLGTGSFTKVGAIVLQSGLGASLPLSLDALSLSL